MRKKWKAKEQKKEEKAKEGEGDRNKNGGGEIGDLRWGGSSKIWGRS